MALPLLSDLDFIVYGVGTKGGDCLLFLIYRLFDQGYSQVAMFRKRTYADRDLRKLGGGYGIGPD